MCRVNREPALKCGIGMRCHATHANRPPKNLHIAGDESTFSGTSRPSLSNEGIPEGLASTARGHDR